MGSLFPGFLLAGICLLTAGPCLANSPALPTESAAFFRAHCVDCHGGTEPDGGLDLGSLSQDVSDEAVFARWERIYDRIEAGEMPPEESPQPSPAERTAILTGLKKTLVEAHAQRKGTVLRRLNRREYENTLNDLFGTHLDLANRLPEDGRAHEFDTVGAALGISTVQLEQYLAASEAVLEAAIAKKSARPEVTVVRASYADTRGAEQHLGRVWLKRPDGAVVFFRRWGYPTGMLREATVAEDGWYTVRITGYAWQSEEPITFGVGATTFARGLETPRYGYYQLPPGKPTTVELKAWIPSRYMIEVTPYGVTDNYEIKRSGIEAYRGPGLAIQHIEVEGPLVDEFPSRGHSLLFDGLERREIEPRNPQDKKKSWYLPKYELTAEAESRIPQALQRIASAAFRRPATEQDVEPYLALYRAEWERGSSAEEALRTATTAIFCSPRFLFLQEPAGHLDDYALANRLSYFLTRSSPDERLLQLAAEGKLTRDRAVLLGEVDRLLADERSERFVADFTDAWLNLRDIEFTTPDQQLFPEFDTFLQDSMVEETRSFFRQLIAKDLPVQNLVQSEYAMLNNRLAEHYGIEGVAGPEIRAVPVAAGSPRGGFLSQGAVLKVSANGTNTSPVVRGVWVMERILNQPPAPPPPGIPGIEPDIRGATTLRELLEKHRSLESCQSCHAAIDPPGFALESFDPIGGWRERFRTLGEGEKVDLTVDSNRVRYRLGPPVDAAGELADGRAFQNFQEFRSHLAEDRDALARGLASKLLTFAAGREMGFSDRGEIARIAQEAAQRDYGVRELLRQVVTSEIFLTK